MPTPGDNLACKALDYLPRGGASAAHVRMIDWLAHLDPWLLMVGIGATGLLLAAPLEFAAFRRLQLALGTLVLLSTLHRTANLSSVMFARAPDRRTPACMVKRPE